MTGVTNPAAEVRPYVVTGGRVPAALSHMALETLMEAAPAALAALRGLPAEKREILSQAIGAYVSVAEVSSHVGLPLGVVKVLVSDLTDEGLLTLHPSVLAGDQGDRGSGRALTVPLDVLEEVLDGIALL